MDKSKYEKLFTRRAIILGSAKIGFLFLLLGRLYYLQIKKSAEYKTFSDSNRIHLLVLLPERGKIMDRNNKALAINRNIYRVLYSSEKKGEGKETLLKFFEILNLKDYQKQEILSNFQKYVTGSDFIVYEDLTWKELALVEVNIPKLPGLKIDIGKIRIFPLSYAISNITGYLGKLFKKGKVSNQLFAHPDFREGKSGVEKIYEKTLRGKAGISKVEVNAYGTVVRELSKQDSISGKDVKISIDADIQEYSYNLFKGRNGSLVLLDIKQGEVLSMVSSPGFNANIFSLSIDDKYWNRLRKDKNKPFLNKPIASQYSPGSTFKIVVALAALRAGISVDTIFNCQGSLMFDNEEFKCWKKGGHGNLNMIEAITHSCNTYFYRIALKLGVDRLAEMSRELGLGEITSIGFEEEKAGLIPTKNWKLTELGEKWKDSETLLVGIGQTYVLVTALQLAVLTARVASGKKVIPLFFKDRKKAENFEKLNIPDKHLDIVRKAMYFVINKEGGTAYYRRMRDSNFLMSGKTGTTEVISSENKTEGKEVLFLKDGYKNVKSHALFLGFYPSFNPEYAVSVVVENGGSGTKSAFPIARDLLYYMMKRNKNS